MSIAGCVSSILGPVEGTFGISAYHTVSGETIALNEQEVFPSASVIKVPILAEVFCQRDEGKLSLDQTLVLRDEHKVAGSGVLKELHAGIDFTLLDLASLMIVVSDNTAANVIIDLVGTEPVNARMRRFGLGNTILARKMYDFEQAALGKENLCTPSDLTLLLKLMAEGRISSKSTSEEMLGIMARQQYRDRIPLLIPDDVRVANKTGSIQGVTHDVGVVYGPSGPYILSIMAKGVSDKVAAERAIADVSKAVYEHFAARD
jgi:beta-lactamase class A